MVEPLTISNQPPSQPGMDYAFLRQEGVKWIEKLAGDRWTDYNAHDPGITILEALCYAITDLSYRLSFEMEDLLAFPPSEADHPPLFLTARDSLTVNPLTLNDYRKLLLDIDINGIKVFKNAWLEPLQTSQPNLFYDADNAKLTFDTPDSFDITELHLRGLYRVLLEKEKGLPFEDRDLENAAKAKLNQHRNLCEDFAEIKVLDIEQITVKAEIEIADHIDPNQLMVELYTALDRTISPSINFFSLPDLLSQGIPVEDIFVGPILKHGFIDDATLNQFQRQAELRTSDLIHVILDLPGVKTVRNITISSHPSPTPQAWVLDLNPDLTPQLKPIQDVLNNGDIKFYKGRIACQFQQITSQDNKGDNQSPVAQSFSNPIQDIPIPIGTYRELSDYESIQSEFPMLYGIGEVGLSAAADPLRKAQAKQLQAYLMVFDQILANYFAQLDHIRHLFALSNPQVNTYFFQSIAHFPGAKEILQSIDETSDQQYLTDLQEDFATDLERKNLDRKNRLLDHLIAQYGETFVDYSLLYPNTTLSTATIQHKVDFAKDYQSVSASRGQAINYTLNPTQRDNVSGLKRRVARLLGIEPDRRAIASENNVESFYFLEHILLRPQEGDHHGNHRDLLGFSRPIQAVRQSSFSGYETVTCTSLQHGLKSGDTINMIYSSHYNGVYAVLNAQPDTFEIQTKFVENYNPDKDAWVRQNQHPDPFSFQVSVVLPNWPPRFRDPNFQTLIYDTFIAEAPAHISLQFHWLNQREMNEFEGFYNLLLQKLSGTIPDNPESQAEANSASTRLINFLGLGSTNIPAIPALIGYMVIGESSSSAPQFVVA
jgi:hypothetical protein